MTHTKDEAQPAPVQEPALVIYQGEIAKSNLPKGFTGMLYATPPAAPVQELTLDIYDEHYNTTPPAQPSPVAQPVESVDYIPHGWPDWMKPHGITKGQP
jgi:hypothetical protein